MNYCLGFWCFGDNFFLETQAVWQLIRSTSRRQSSVNTCLKHELKNVNNRTFYFLQTWYPRYQRNHLSLSVLCLKLFLHKYVKSRVTSGSKFIFQIFYVVVKRLYRLVTRHFDNASWVIWYFPWAPEITEGGTDEEVVVTSTDVLSFALLSNHHLIEISSLFMVVWLFHLWFYIWQFNKANQVRFTSELFRGLIICLPMS